MNIKTEQEMLDLGRTVATEYSAEHKDLARAARNVSEGHVVATVLPSVIELIGDVGAGKTTFVRGFAEALGVKEPVTSPSFTISKSYALPNNKTLIHYDFYRLPDPGIMLDELAENLTNPKNIIVVEWAESVANILPKNRTIITINYNDDGTREVNIISPAQ